MLMVSFVLKLASSDIHDAKKDLVLGGYHIYIYIYIYTHTYIHTYIHNIKPDEFVSIMDLKNI